MQENSDIVGTPKQATQEDKLAFVTYILQEIGLSRASVKSCDVQAMNNDTSGQEIWRLSFKDFTSKKKISDFMKSPKNWNLEFWGIDNQIWKGYKIWGRWTE